MAEAGKDDVLKALAEHGFEPDGVARWTFDAWSFVYDDATETWRIEHRCFGCVLSDAMDAEEVLEFFGEIDAAKDDALAKNKEE